MSVPVAYLIIEVWKLELDMLNDKPEIFHKNIIMFSKFSFIV
jgi:hypothetical protein